MRGVVAPEPPSSLHPAALPHRIWCCSCSQLCCAAPRPKMFAPIIFAEVTACSNVAELWPHNTSRVTTGFLFPVNIKISWAERIVLFLFSLMVVGFFLHVRHSHRYIIRVTGSGRGWQNEGRAQSSLWTGVCHVPALGGSDGFKGHCWAPCYLCICTNTFRDADQMLSWAAHVNSQQWKNQR